MHGRRAALAADEVAQEALGLLRAIVAGRVIENAATVIDALDARRVVALQQILPKP